VGRDPFQRSANQIAGAGNDEPMPKAMFWTQKSIPFFHGIAPLVIFGFAGL
jgi:hypothetical protein